MAKSKHAAVGTRPGNGRVGDALVALAAALLAAWTHRATLGMYFAPDDVILFERVRHLAPYPPTLWRILSGRVWFEVFFPAFGVEPAGWHALSLALHALATALVALWVRRLGAARALALVAAVAFGAALRARTVLWAVTGTGEILAAIFALGALLVLESRVARRGPWAALLQALGLLSKETVVFAPLAAVATGAGPGWRARVRAAAPALAVSLAWLAYLAWVRARIGSLGGEAYAAGFGPHVLRNLVTDVVWCADLTSASGLLPQPWPAPVNVAALALLLALAAYAVRSGSAPARAGLVLWATMILPVLPLVNMSYEAYVYLARAGFVLAMADAVLAGVRTLASRIRARTEVPEWSVAIVLVLVPVVSTTVFLGLLRDARDPATGIAQDSFLRKMDAIRAAATSLDGQLPEGGARLVVYSPPGQEYFVSTRTGRETSAPAARRYSMLAAVLDDGLGLRALRPRLTDVSLREHVERADSNAVVAANTSDCSLWLAGSGPAGHIALAQLWAKNGATAQARLHLREAAALDSGSADLALALAQSSPPESLAAALAAVVARFPGSEAARIAVATPVGRGPAFRK